MSFPCAVSDELQRGIERIWRYFEPFDPDIENFECARKYINACLFREEVWLSPVSAHQQLEAMLRWRAWLEESGA